MLGLIVSLRRPETIGFEYDEEVEFDGVTTESLMVGEPRRLLLRKGSYLSGYVSLGSRFYLQFQ